MSFWACGVPPKGDIIAELFVLKKKGYCYDCSLHPFSSSRDVNDVKSMSLDGLRMSNKRRCRIACLMALKSHCRPLSNCGPLSLHDKSKLQTEKRVSLAYCAHFVHASKLVTMNSWRAYPALSRCFLR